MPLKAAIIPVTPIQQNCALIWDDVTMQAAVVDPGGDVPRILEAIGSLKLRVGLILLTHGHFDHAGGAAELRDALAGVQIVGPDERDAYLLDGLAETALTYGIPGARNVRPDRWVHEGEHVMLGTHRFDVLHTPGHTPGHVIFVQRAAGFAVVGDVIFQGSVGRTDLPRGDGPTLLRSIRDKVMPLGDAMAFMCGHGPGSTLGMERQANPFVREALALRD